VCTAFLPDLALTLSPPSPREKGKLNSLINKKKPSPRREGSGGVRVKGFFEPIIKWFKQFTIEANRQITLEVDNFCQSHDLYWKYFAEILNLLEDYNSKGQVKVIWHCADIDELECAEEFSTICDKLEFVLVKSEGFH
jgi:hypothetical protein